MDKTKYWIAFSHIKDIGAVTIKKLWVHFRCIKEAWSASSAELYRVPIEPKMIETLIFQRPKISPDALMEKLEKDNIKALCYEDPLYPPLLKEIKDPPVVLYYRGNLDAINFDKTISIVGTRKPTPYAQSATYNIAKELLTFDTVLVSGFAEGIDTECHKACLEQNGSTVAILGSGLNDIYPKSNAKLAKSLIDTGKSLVMSEYPPDIPPAAWQFPYRNRIISALSNVTVIMEANKRSGALITANYAKEHHRKIVVLPTRAGEGNEGGFKLINELYPIFTTTEELLRLAEIEVPEDYCIKNVSPPSTTLIPDDKKDKDVLLVEKSIMTIPNKEYIPINAEEEKVLFALKDDSLTLDRLVAITGISATVLMGTLTMMELNGAVLQINGKRYKKNI